MSRKEGYKCQDNKGKSGRNVKIIRVKMVKCRDKKGKSGRIVKIMKVKMFSK